MKILKVLGIVVLTIAITGLGAYLYMRDIQPKDLAFAQIDIEAIPDGTYAGSAKFAPVKVSLEVTVSGGSITAIEIKEHANGKGKPAEDIIGRIIEAQSLEVDTITGATWSSYTILKAVEDALLVL
ncbi:MAG TPA: FMN-binding protein [Bacillota bacterium]|nr:FMN-binding protein [Bacillota bacterium]HOA14789.1 FMN-binding protein [Bacillota bacterium]HOG52560.1 FMN-binding protein [Bacillota bacterium]